MRDLVPRTVPKWPFFAGDILLLFTAYLIYYQARLPLGLREILCCCGCVALGAVLAIIPFLLDFRLMEKSSENESLTDAVSQIKELKTLATQISGATSQWVAVQEGATKTAASAKQIAEGMAAEIRGFNEFMARSNDSEKSMLRLELDKLRRAEADWLQVAIRMLDHTFALHSAVSRAGQPKLAEQIGNFQAACRDAARRVGLAPFGAMVNEPFDATRHQPYEGDGKPPESAIVTEVLATGYSFQGRMLRHVLVKVAPAPTEPESAEPAGGTDELPLGTS